MKKILLNTVAFFVVSLFLISCNNENEDEDEIIQNEVILFIESKSIRRLYPHREAVFMVVTDRTFNWTFHLETIDIEDFVYEEGFEYELKVLRTKLRNPPADAPVFTYSLIEILSKKKVE
jgi:hypothetical protein